MIDPDFQDLALRSRHPTVEWSDAWLFLVSQEPHDGRREAIWDCVFSLSPFYCPTDTARILVKMSQEGK